MIKLAVLADVHGNSIALRAVLSDLQMQGGADHIISLGDLAVYGPDSTDVLNVIHDHEPIFHVCGNTDRYLVQGLYPANTTGQDWQSLLLASFPWTAAQLGKNGLRFLASLPPQQLLRFTEDHTILAVHGSPLSDEDNILPDTPDSKLASMLGEQSCDLMLCAHTHVPLARMVRGRLVVNVGSVGIPFDGDPRASYAMVFLQPKGGYRIEFRRVPYDIDAVVAQLHDFGHPAAELIEYNLRHARRVSPKLPYTEKMKQGVKPLPAS